MNQAFRVLLLLTSIFLLSGCLAPVKIDTSTAYLLNTVPQPPTQRSNHEINLLVNQPLTIPVYNTTQMAYTDKPYQVAYYIKNNWAETPAQMLQPLIVKTLQKTHYFHVVNPSPMMGHYHFVLNTQILQLEQDLIYQPHQVRLTIRAELVNAATGEVVAVKEFSISESMRNNTPYGGVVAANIATTRFLRQLAQFCLQELKND